MPRNHGATVSAEKPSCTNAGGRPIHPLITIAEEIAEALAVVDNDVDVLEKIARLNVETAKIAHHRAQRLREVLRPSFEAASALAEQLVLDRKAA